MTLALAVAQTCPRSGDIDANTEEHIRLAEVAAEQGARLVLFPELSLTGYELELAPALSYSEDDRRLSSLIDTAASHSITLVVGAPVRIATRLHIGAFIVHPDRTIALYTKQRLGAFSPADAIDGTVPPPESSVFEPGDRDPLIRFDTGTAAVAVCADIGHAAHPRAAAERGAGVYLASMFVIPADLENDLAKLQSYAVQHSMVVALANFGAPTGGLPAAGHSSIWSATGELLVQLDAAGAGVGVAIEDSSGWHVARRLLGSRHAGARRPA